MGYLVTCAKCRHKLHVALPRKMDYTWRGEPASTVLMAAPNCNGFHEEHGHVMGDIETIPNMMKFSNFAEGQGVVQVVLCGKCNADLGCKILESSYADEMGLYCLGDTTIKPEYQYVLKGVEAASEQERLELVASKAR
eukprot:TRINITY_DN4302_c0_g1_i1.p2 TRINITY_DN4302_c0_g1~~TRINITY_DN4302_c0_g1_i1.p2  ORF type:complete len:138 (+),score=46.10 TRINITY_DN4302_c0_g1_i1:100-513(+)